MHNYYLTTKDFMSNKDMAVILKLQRRLKIIHRIQQKIDSHKKHSYPWLCQWQSDISSILRVCETRLVKDKILSRTARQVCRSVANRYGITNQEVYEYFDYEKPVYYTKNGVLWHWLAIQKRRAKLAAVASLKSRLRMALYEAHTHGWYVVFNTLTVSDDNIDAVFAKGSKHFRDYIRNITRAVGRQNELTSRQSDELVLELHKYFAVVERGDETGRLHIHVMHMLKTLPKGCTDPNYGIVDGMRREIQEFKKYWRYGLSAPIAIRYGHEDAFSRDGWQWPLRKDKTGLTILFSSGTIDQVANYVGGYLDMQRLEGKWKTRMTRNLGLHRIQEIMEKMSSRTLLKALRAPRKQSTPPRVPHWSILASLMRKMLLMRGHFRGLFAAYQPQENICVPGAIGRRLLEQMLHIRSTGNFSRQNWMKVISNFAIEKDVYNLAGRVQNV